MGISGLSNQVSRRNDDIYQKLSTMKKVNSAKDNAAGLAIANKLLSQANGLDVGYDNAGSAKDMLNVAEGGLSSISDSLQRMRELSIEAGNIAYGPDEKQAIQAEIDGLKQGIQDVAKGTEFNTKPLLDGSQGELNFATGADGSGTSITIPDSTLQTLGIKDFDVTGNFDISTIDRALEMVTSSRSSIGAKTNVMDSVMNSNSITSLNTTNARSRIEDLDVGKAVSDKEKNRVLEQYQYFAQSAKIAQNKRQTAMFGA